MKWICNIINPADRHARSLHLFVSDNPRDQNAEWHAYNSWVRQHKIGRPHPPLPDSPTVEELEKIGLVGLYKNDDETEI